MSFTNTLQKSIAEAEKERQQHAIEGHNRLKEEQKQAPARKVQVKEIEERKNCSQANDPHIEEYFAEAVVEQSHQLRDRAAAASEDSALKEAKVSYSVAYTREHIARAEAHLAHQQGGARSDRGKCQSGWCRPERGTL